MANDDPTRTQLLSTFLTKLGDDTGYLVRLYPVAVGEARGRERRLDPGDGEHRAGVHAGGRRDGGGPARAGGPQAVRREDHGAEPGVLLVRFLARDLL